METKLTPMPPEDKGKGWEQQLQEIPELQMFAREAQQAAEPATDIPTLTIVSIYHKLDRDLWFAISQHLDLLSVPGYHLKRCIVPLMTDAEPERQHIATFLAKPDLKRAHLILLCLSVDLITALLQHKELCSLLNTEDSPTILPIALRPVYWECPYTCLDPVPKETVVLYANRDVAHTTIAKSVHWLLTAAVEDTHEEDDDAE